MKVRSFVSCIVILIAAFSVSRAANANTVLYYLPEYGLSFTLDSAAAQIDGELALSIRFDNVPYAGVSVAGDVYSGTFSYLRFFSYPGWTGGFDDEFSFFPSMTGPQLYIGAPPNVTLLTGDFVLHFGGSGSQNSLRVTEVAPTPLPGALPLFATGLGAIGLMTWRRKRKSVVLAA